MKIVKLDITEDNLLSGVDAVALVMNPAHEEDFFAFKKQSFQSYNDYPEAAVNAAKRALEWRDSHPDNDCGTPVGWARANQLAKRENISQETIARMASFARHLQYEDVPYSEGCGGLMVDAWGGRAGIEWASRKLEEIKSEFADTVPGVNLENVDDFIKAIVQGYFQTYYFNPELFYNNSGLNVSGLTDWLNEFPGDEPLYEYPWYVYSVEGNLNILGYQTKAFDMCPGAIAHFTHLLTMDLDEDTKGMVRSAAVVADMIFLVEKQIEEHGIANHDQLVEAISLVDDFTDIMHEVDKAVGMEHSVDYMQGHIDYIASMVPSAFQEDCPPATLDVELNLKNRQNAIDVAHYGPLNPNEPNEGYWKAKAAQFGGDIESAKKALCGNCAAFIQTTKMLDCISSGLGTEIDVEQTINAGNLGYCEIFDFKCASRRTCDAWIGGGPIVDKPTDTEQLIEIATSIMQLSKLDALVSGKEKKKLPAAPISHSPQAFARKTLAMERKIIGPLVIPNKLILRVDEEGNNYYVYFTEDTVKRIADKFMKEGRTKAFNLEHDIDRKLHKIYITEAWLVTDPEKDKSNSFGLKPRRGTWMAITKIENEGLWKNYIREGKVNGYSVEGFFVDKLFSQGTQQKFVEPTLGE